MLVRSLIIDHLAEFFDELGDGAAIPYRDLEQVDHPSHMLVLCRVLILNNSNFLQVFALSIQNHW